MVYFSAYTHSKLFKRTKQQETRARSHAILCRRQWIKPHKKKYCPLVWTFYILPAVLVTCDPSVEVALVAGGCFSETWYSLPSGTDSDVSTKRWIVFFTLN